MEAIDADPKPEEELKQQQNKELKKKLLSQIKRENGLYFCPYCPKWSNSRSLILQHLSRVKPCSINKMKLNDNNFKLEKGRFIISFH
jgi:hypothetical protein